MISPLTPAECDLRDYPYLGIDIATLFGSEFHAKATDAEWRAGVTLWLKAFHQVPAASLPNDDASLARLAEFARDLKSWRKVKEMALHGWREASDGRLYHPVVAVKALEGWVEKLRQRKSSAAGTAKRYGTEYDPQSFDDAIRTALAMLAVQSPHSRVLRIRSPVGTASGTAGGSTDVVPPVSQEKGSEGKEREVSSQPVSLPAKKQEINFLNASGKKNGKIPGVTIKDPLQRVAIFQQKLSAFIGGNGHDITTAAMNLDDPTHADALKFCRSKAIEMGAKDLPWTWPLQHMGNVAEAREHLKAVADRMRARASQPKQSGVEAA